MEPLLDVRRQAWAGTAIGTLATIAVGGLFGAWRGHVGPTNGTLALAIVVVGAASLGGRRAGLLTAVAATAAFNFFLVPPYLTLWIAAGKDAAAVVLLAVLGFVAGVGAEQHGRANSRVADDIEAITAVSDLVYVVAEPARQDRSWDQLRTGLRDAIGASALRFVPAPLPHDVSTLPLLDGHGVVHRLNRGAQYGAVRHLNLARRGLTLPTDGVSIRVDPFDDSRGRVVIAVDSAVGSRKEHRMAAVAMVRIWGMANAPAERSALVVTGPRADAGVPQSLARTSAETSWTSWS